MSIKYLQLFCGDFLWATKRPGKVLLNCLRRHQLTNSDSKKIFRIKPRDQIKKKV